MPLEKIQTLLATQSGEINSWFDKKWGALQPLPYFSCDIRHASYKIGIVDTNLFPAGFNNLCSNFIKATAEEFETYFKNFYPNARRILLFGENHTRNKFYLLNLLRLQNIIIKTGRECRITIPLDHFPQSRNEIHLTDSETIVIEECQRDNGTIKIGDFTADLVLSNNDFSSGSPALLQNINIPIVPAPELGWHQRSKSGHFVILNELLSDFSETFKCDVWRVMPITRIVSEVSPLNWDGLKSTVAEVLNLITRKYEEYQIQETPYVFIKNDSGTYGLGIATVSSLEELDSMNRKKREKLFAAKSGGQTSRFIVQEGIPTTDTYSGYPIEPVIYGVGKNPVAGFFRVHENKTPFESLNAPGMTFSCLCLHKLDEPHEEYFLNCKDKARLVSASKFLARFAALAAAIEAEKLKIS